MRLEMKKISIIVLVAICMCMVVGCSKGESGTRGKNEGANKKVQKGEILTEENIPNLLSGMHHAEIEVIDYGTIKVELDADSAPVSVTNFVNHINTHRHQHRHTYMY